GRRVGGKGSFARQSRAHAGTANPPRPTHRGPHTPPARLSRLCEPDHTVPACPELHFHLLVTDLDSEGGSSWETPISPPRRRRTPARQRAKAQSAESVGRQHLSDRMS